MPSPSQFNEVQVEIVSKSQRRSPLDRYDNIENEKNTLHNRHVVAPQSNSQSRSFVAHISLPFTSTILPSFAPFSTPFSYLFTHGVLRAILEISVIFVLSCVHASRCLRSAFGHHPKGHMSSGGCRVWIKGV